MARLADTPQTILVAEDSSDDVFFVQHAIRQVCGKEVVVVKDGQQCIDYLSTCIHGPGANARPDLLILDIKMPRADGHEVLAWLREQPALKDMPVIVMSGAVQPRDRLLSLAAGAKAYFTKPTDLGEILEIVKQCGQRWGKWRESAPDNTAS